MYLDAKAEDMSHLNRLYEYRHSGVISEAAKDYLDKEIHDLERDIVRRGAWCYRFKENWEPRPWEAGDI